MLTALIGLLSLKEINQEASEECAYCRDEDKNKRFRRTVYNEKGKRKMDMLLRETELYKCFARKEYVHFLK